MIFAYGMIAAGILASGIAYYEGNKGSVFGGFFVVYLIYTAVTTVKPVSFNTKQLQIALMLFAFMNLPAIAQEDLQHSSHTALGCKKISTPSLRLRLLPSRIDFERHPFHWFRGSRATS